MQEGHNTQHDEPLLTYEEIVDISGCKRIDHQPRMNSQESSYHYFSDWKWPFIFLGIPSIIFGSIFLALFPASQGDEGDEGDENCYKFPRLNWAVSFIMAATVFFSIAGIAPFHKIAISKRYDLLSSSAHVPQTKLAALFLGSSDALVPETWLHLITGDASPYLWWQLRGLLWISLVFAFCGFLTAFLLLKYFSCLSDGLSFDCGCFGFFVALTMGYCTRAIFIPFTLLSAQVGFSVGSGTRIGLWDRSDPSLRALQLLSFQYALTFTIALSLAITGCFLSGLPFWMSSITTTCSVSIIMVILLAPILPLTATLSNKKADLLASLSTLIEKQHIHIMDNFKAGLSNEEAMKTLEWMYEERKKITDVNVLPESMKLIYTALMSVGIAIVPMVYQFISSQI